MDIPLLDAKVVSSYVSLLGLPLGALIAGTGYYLKTKRENKKSARRLLYIMLELRYSTIIGMIRPDDVVDAIKEIVERKYNVPKDSMPTVIEDQILKYLPLVFSSIRTDIETDLKENYDIALREFSEINPMLAFNFNGLERIEGYHRLMSEYDKEYHQNVSCELLGEQERKLLETHFKKLRFNAQEELIDKLNTDIKSLSKYCGASDWFRCKIYLLKYKPLLDIYIEKLEKQTHILIEGMIKDKKLENITVVDR